ncbi:MAG: hypothetical protein COA42_15745 [Alteromonadaceae bacterium]|nr:MAG: hypothetical protein COA42_15745 [Alteromonadaceae bacterium]
MDPNHVTEELDTAVSYVNAGLDILVEIGVERSLVLENTGLTSKELGNIDGFVSSSKIIRLVDNIEALTGIKGTGLFFGGRLGFSHHGMLGIAALSRATLTEAIDTLIEYAKSRFHGVTFTHVNRGNYSGFGIELDVINEKFSIYISELIFATVYRHLDSMSNSQLSNAIIRFRHAKPDYFQLYTNLFQQKVEFGSECYELLLDEDEFSKGLSYSCEETFESASHIIKNQMPASKESTFIDRVNDLIEKSDMIPSIESTAKTFNMSVRSLRRRLSEAGITYTSIVNVKKCSLAEAYLAGGKFTISEVAQRLEFSNASSFSKAFKQWKGVSPKSFKTSLLKSKE